MSDTRSRTLDLLTTLVAILVEPAERLPLSSDTDARNLQLTESLARNFGILAQLPGDDDVATVTYSVGTDSRDYSTWVTWEADLDNGALYSSGDIARGEGYNDSPFDGSFTSDGGSTIGLAEVIMTAAAGEEHDGTAGTGVRFVNSGAATYYFGNSGIPQTMSWIEIDWNGNEFQAGQGIAATGTSNSFSNLLLHGSYSTVSNNILVNVAGWALQMTNCIAYDHELDLNVGIRYLRGMSITTGNSTTLGAWNCTFHDFRRNQAGDLDIFHATGKANFNIRNCIATDPSGTSAGTKQCYNITSPTVADHNLSSDSTASGTGSLTSKSASNQFVSIVPGSEDLHLKAGADAIDAGTDLGTTPTGVNIDIDGRDRDLEGDTWDMGADEFVAAGGGGGEGAAVQYYNQLTMQVLR